MLDPKVVTKMVEDQIAISVNQKVQQVFENNDWIEPIEQRVIKYTQDRIVGKFSNSESLPELVEAIKIGVQQVFASGNVPGIENYVDADAVKQCVDQAVENTVTQAITHLGQDPAWLEKIEKIINQSMVQRTVAQLGSIDIASIVRQRVDEQMQDMRIDFLNNFSSTGIDDRATACQLTIMDDATVVENRLTAQDLDVVGGLTVKDLVVRGSINTDNRSWDILADTIGQKALESIDVDWRDRLTNQVVERIQDQGIDFSNVTINGESLIKDNSLSGGILHSKLRQVGVLDDLKVNTTLTVNRRRVGINTEEPEAVFSVWDEEVSIIAGKHKNQEAFIGTNRLQTVNFGVNKEPQLILSTDGITSVKKLRVGQHRIGHSSEVPNWAGVRGDIMFNSNPTPGSAFAWVCTSGFKWKVIKVEE